MNGRGVWGRTDPCICMAESPCCPPETTLLISYTPIQNKNLKKRKNRWLWIFPSTEVRSFRTGIKTSPHREKNNASSQLSTIRDSLHWLKHFSSGSAVKNPPAVQEAQETQVWSLGQEGPLEKGVAAHSSILAWSIHSMDRGGWRATVYRVAKSRTWPKWLSMHAYMHWL